MSLQLFRVEGGISDGNISYLSGTGVPGGDSSYQDAAGLGSYYSETATGDTYKKTAAGTGTDKWTNVSVAINNISWREPVEVNAVGQTTLPTGTAGSTITVDGEVINDGERVLFPDLTAPSDRNVWIYNQASGTFSEDPNAESKGDTLYVIRGTQGGQTWTYNTANTWVFANSTTLDELGYIRTFIGKGASGSVTPVYTEDNYIADGDSLAVAVDKIDQALRDAEDRIDNATVSLGINADGTMTAFSGTNYINGMNFYAALQALDTAVATAEGDLIDVTADNVTTSTVVDSVSVDDETCALWIVNIRNTAENKFFSCHIFGQHNGTAAADATSADHNRSSILREGGNPTGLSFDVVVSGTGAAQTMNLVVSSTEAVNVRAARVSVAN